LAIIRIAFKASTDGPDYPILTDKGPLNELFSRQARLLPWPQQGMPESLLPRHYLVLRRL